MTIPTTPANPEPAFPISVGVHLTAPPTQTLTLDNETGAGLDGGVLADDVVLPSSSPTPAPEGKE